MKKKVFFILSSLSAGGSERVFWLLSQGFDKSQYEINIVLLNSKNRFFTEELNNVNIIDLKTVRASKSFFKLYSLLKKEKPHAVFATGGQINVLVGLISLFVKIPFIIARQSNIPDEKKNFSEGKGKFWTKYGDVFLKRFNSIVCQSDEMRASVERSFRVDKRKLVIIPNPIIPSATIKDISQKSDFKRLIIVARLVKLKGHERLLDTLKTLPENYTLTIAGDGPMQEELVSKVKALGLQERVNFVGQVSQVEKLVAQHDLLVLASFTEGFPNVVIEALSVGTPVVTFKVGGVSYIIKEDFNGYIVGQGDLDDFRAKIIKACSKNWDPVEIKNDINKRFSINTIVSTYQKLIA